jgi:hypothetical protein
MRGVVDPLKFEGLTEPTQWLRLAEDWAGEGRYEDALRAHEFYHRHALEVESSQYGVRLSFALAAWTRLGALHEPALEALRATRRAAATAAIEARDVERFWEALSIDQWLDDETSSYALMGEVEASFPDTVAEFTDDRVLRILVERREYERALRWIGDVWTRYAHALELHIDGQTSDLPDHAEWSRRTALDWIRQLILILLGANQTGLAEEIAQRAADQIDDPRLISALNDARRIVGSGPPV